MNNQSIKRFTTFGAIIGIIGTILNVSNAYSFQFASYIMWTFANFLLLVFAIEIRDKSLSIMYLTYFILSLVGIYNRVQMI